MNIIRGRTRGDVAKARGMSVDAVAADDAAVDAIVVTGAQLRTMSDVSNSSLTHLCL